MWGVNTASKTLVVSNSAEQQSGTMNEIAGLQPSPGRARHLQTQFQPPLALPRAFQSVTFGTCLPFIAGFASALPSTSTPTPSCHRCRKYCQLGGGYCLYFPLSSQGLAGVDATKSAK